MSWKPHLHSHRRVVVLLVNILAFAFTLAPAVSAVKRNPPYITALGAIGAILSLGHVFARTIEAASSGVDGQRLKQIRLTWPLRHQCDRDCPNCSFPSTRHWPDNVFNVDIAYWVLLVPSFTMWIQMLSSLNPPPKERGFSILEG
ncbi:hypothetical protein LENED_006785 [Lentinula edodes]|uniref:Uncharacterized protein n=1 Tax=Lentinula edodes TaxID=5353 RepID=A0A1Q3ECM7_LENED|nr:hypothetical protein LENED_006785 [Lentinula edodes]